MADLDSVESENIDDPVPKVKQFMQDGCGCTLSGKGGQCCEQFSEETVLFNFSNCQELSNGELNLVILTSIQAFTHSDPIGGIPSASPAGISCSHAVCSMLIGCILYHHPIGVE